MASLRDRALITHITNIRTTNNVQWMTLLQIALNADPKRTKAVLQQINENDQQISELLRELADT